MARKICRISKSHFDNRLNRNETKMEHYKESQHDFLHIVILTSFPKFYSICYFSYSKDNNPLSKQVEYDHLVFEEYSERLINYCFFEQTILREQGIVAVALSAKFQKPSQVQVSEVAWNEWVQCSCLIRLMWLLVSSLISCLLWFLNHSYSTP